MCTMLSEFSLSSINESPDIDFLILSAIITGLWEIGKLLILRASRLVPPLQVPGGLKQTTPMNFTFTLQDTMTKEEEVITI